MLVLTFAAAVQNYSFTVHKKREMQNTHLTFTDKTTLYTIIISVHPTVYL
jgi:hypothetical protein